MLHRRIRTKIVCTLGPDLAGGVLEKFLRAGMDCARLNMSHSRSFALSNGRGYVPGETYQEDLWRLNQVRQAGERTGIPVAILGDLQGSKIRLGDFTDPAGVTLQTGQRFTFFADPERAGDAQGAALQFFSLLQPSVEVGAELAIADGDVRMTISEVHADRIAAFVGRGGPVGARQGVVFPGFSPPLPVLTDKDRADLAFLCDAGADWIAVSYLRHPDEVAEVRAAMGDHRIPLMGKIETAEAVANLDGLLAALDGAMVARGDLGVRLPYAEVPLVQKAIIERCNVLGIPVITATQMLDSMEQQDRPTRAEVTDVANAILDGTDAVMLSGETAKGKFPVEAIGALAAIAERVEGRGGPFSVELSPSAVPVSAKETVLQTPAYRLTYKERNFKLEAAIQRLRQAGAYPESGSRRVADAIARAAADVAETLGLGVILCPTASGMTPRLVARFRPGAQIIAATEDPQVARQLLLSYGITPLVVELPSDCTTEEYLRQVEAAAVKAGAVRDGEAFLFTAGYPLREPGSTNLLTVHVARG